MTTPQSVAPTVTGVTYDKADVGYPPGDLMTVAVTYTFGESVKSETSQWAATDPTTNLQGVMSQTFFSFVRDGLDWTVSDDAGRSYTKISDDGAGNAVFTATN